MGYQVYEHQGRDCGYGVPAECDHPDCRTEIDRGVSYLCGGEPGGGEHGCGLFFCNDHLNFASPLAPLLCDRCITNEAPCQPKPDLPKWVYFKMTDPSWAEWRNIHNIETHNIETPDGFD